MFKKITIQNFRGIKDLTIDDFGKINLLVGKNNSCKTSVLEALKIAYWKNAFNEIIKTNNHVRRFYLELNDCKNPLETFNAINKHFTNTFYKLDLSQKIIINSEWNGSKEELTLYSDKTKQEQHYEWYFDLKFNQKDLKSQNNLIKSEINSSEEETFTNSITSSIKFQQMFLKEPDISLHEDLKNDSRFACFFFDSNMAHNFSAADLKISYGKIIRNKKEEELAVLLKDIDQSIKDIKFDGEDILVDIGIEERLEGRLMGEGIQKIFFLALIILSEEINNGVLLIDEIENGLHYTAQEKLWNWLFDIAKEKKIQIFATTHSIDTVRSFTKAAEDKEEKDIRLFKLLKKDDEIKVRKQEFESLDNWLEEYEENNSFMEIR